MPSRRELLTCAAAVIAAAAASVPFAGRASPQPPARRGPRYFLSLYLSGGIDPITSADPKTRAEVEPWVDVPFEPSAIVTAGDLRLGPHLAPLALHVARLSVVTGVALKTANHNTGAEQFLRMKTGTRPQMPTVLDLIGSRRDGQAMGCMDWLFGAAQFTRLFGSSSSATRADLHELAEALRAEARRLLAGSSGPADRATAARLDETSALFARVSAIPRPRIERWSERDDEQAVAVALQRILWVFENDLSRCFELNIGGVEQPWDTHTFNADRQATASAPLSMVGRFFGELERRRTPRGPLAAETLVVMGSEIGRFPALNTARGKDHFPEAPFVLFGAGMGGAGRGAAFGRTGRNMAAVPISTRTGNDVAGGHALALDDLGATLLHLAGVPDPRVYGYDGQVLEFLGA